MRTFIDESGIFISPVGSNIHKLSVVVSLTIPEYSYTNVCNLFLQLKSSWGFVSEVKGSELTENQVHTLVAQLEKHNVLFNAVMVDSKFLTPTIIANHKSKFANYILGSISPHHHSNVVRTINELSTTISTLSDQLYIQSLAMTSLIDRTHQLTTLFYVQRTPEELAKFSWIIDAKDKNLTKYEKWWHDMLNHLIQGMNQKHPMIMLEGADYRYYDNFNDDIDPSSGSVNKIMKDLSFKDSAAEEGLQLVDIVTTSFCRALNKNFQINGWRSIGRLMIHMQGQNILGIVLDDSVSSLQNVPYYHVINTLNNEARSVWP